MSERREFFRMRTFARVALQPLRPEEVERARVRTRTRNVNAMTAPGALEDAKISSENRAMLELLQHIAMTLERIDQKFAAISEERETPKAEFQGLEINLSGSGFAASFDVELPMGSFVEVQIDLWDAGLPLIRAVACVRAIHPSDRGPAISAFSFEELLPEDLERIVQLTLRAQGQEFRDQRQGETK